MDEQKKQLLEKIKSSTNILVTVSANPSVDQLAACIGLTLLLNKADKHATAVFSGDVPSTIDFLKPEDTLEKTTDSLRDFIIALDKSKADKLRYKVEDKIVKIFITPYRTNLTSDDLDFSQGDFNVDMVLALGVHQQTDLDQAITAHGRILHDAVVACINNTPNGELGTVNWQELSASSLSELVAELSKDLGKQLLDDQIATALLTGIVAETDRFRNEKTSSVTMNLSGELMAAGANQQLVADQLEHAVNVRSTDNAAENQSKNDTSALSDVAETEDIKVNQDGMLEINHDAGEPEPPVEESTPETEQPDTTTAPASQVTTPTPEATPPAPSLSEAPEHAASRSLITEAPSFGGSLTANSTPEYDMPDPAIDSLGIHDDDQPLLDHDQSSASATPAADSNNNLVAPSEPVTPIEMPAPVAEPQPVVGDTFAPPEPDAPEVPAPSSIPPEPPAPEPSAPAPSVFAPTPPAEPALPPVSPSPVPEATPEVSVPTPSFAPPEPVQHETLTELEESVGSPHLELTDDGKTDVQSARDAVLKALTEQPNETPEPIQALNAQPLDLTPPQPPAAPTSDFGQPSLPPLPPEAPSAMPPQPPQINQPDQPPFANSPADQPLTMPTPPGITLPPPQTPPTPPSNDDPNAPPPVPPPMMPFPPAS